MVAFVSCLSDHSGTDVGDEESHEQQDEGGGEDDDEYLGDGSALEECESTECEEGDGDEEEGDETESNHDLFLCDCFFFVDPSL